MQDFQLVAHRGYPNRFPDNSLMGIQAALNAGAEFLEIDVQLSTSGTPWLFHDETLDRVCGREGRLVDLDDREISQLRASEAARFGDQFAEERIASLVDVARELSVRPNVFTFVEIKPVAVEAFGAEQVVDAVAGCLQDLMGQITIISFSIDCLRAVSERTPHSYGLILESWGQVETDLTRVGGSIVFCNHEKLPSASQIDLDMQLAVYEVIDPELAMELGRRGAHFVETFAYPEMSAALGR
jgi:glycerophosphoryl diester phosphodiesterase